MMSSMRIYARARQHTAQSTVTGVHSRGGISGVSESRKAFLTFEKAATTQFLDVLGCREEVMLYILILNCFCP